jgi:hypothetical protein
VIHPLSRPAYPRIRRHVRGAASVEFALTAGFFLTLVFGVVEMGRMSWTFNAANDATRLGVRLAAVGEESEAGIRDRMRALLPMLRDENIAISYPSSGCQAYDCSPVTVSIENLNFESFIPLLPLRVGLPSFRSSLTRESRDTAARSDGTGRIVNGDYCE